eukprot:TRINITY_DN3130_c0_g1_i4.p1 TRINITY_DN3130_c0_g1~~TRINITY_DN3130_c0_g1_i4.p1  ORF type:complete len:178 (-),score=34.37 TRINITY_DN3130_c0_g1_i4:73-582(-)
MKAILLVSILLIVVSAQQCIQSQSLAGTSCEGIFDSDTASFGSQDTWKLLNATIQNAETIFNNGSYGGYSLPKTPGCKSATFYTMCTRSGTQNPDFCIENTGGKKPCRSVCMNFAIQCGGLSETKATGVCLLATSQYAFGESDCVGSSDIASGVASLISYLALFIFFAF